MQATAAYLNTASSPDSSEVYADHVLVASESDSDFLSTLGIETEQEPDGPVQEIVTDGDDRTSVDGI